MLKIKNKIKINYFSIISIVFIILSILSFSISFFNTGNPGSEIAEHGVDTPISLGNIAGYLKFISKDKLYMIKELAVHNFAIATLTLFLSLVTSGILSTFSIISAFYIAGAVIRSSFNLATIGFVSLEMLGIILASIVGVYLSQKRKKEEITTKQIFLYFAITILILFIIYILAACIEANLISGTRS